MAKCDVCPPNLHSEVSRLRECGKSGEFQDIWWEHWVEGYSCMSAEQVRRGVWCQGDPASYPSLDVCPLPFLWVSPLTGSHSSVHPWLWATPVFPVRLSISARFMMTRCSPEAKPVCVSAIISLVRALRHQLKAFRCLLLLKRSDTSPPQPTFYTGQKKLLNRKNDRPVSGCGPTQSCMTVSSHGDDSFSACF